MDHEPCHGVFDGLRTGSQRWIWSTLLKPWQKVHSYVAWHIENLGWAQGLRNLCLGGHNGHQTPVREDKRAIPSREQETLGLQPGEWVEIKPIEEILMTLDGRRRHRGLRWMTGMRKYCGRRFRVYRRVDRIMLETNGELRKMKDTVLLEGVMCDGVEFGACNRSCFHFWREVWLRRVPEGYVNNPSPDRTVPDEQEV